MDGRKDADGRGHEVGRRDLLAAVGAGALLPAGVGASDRRADGTVRSGAPGDEARFLYYNTWLLDGLFGLGASPDLEGRARELGEILATVDYDVAALSEVFDEEQRRQVREPVEDVVERTGPPADIELSSGLQTLVEGDHEVVATNRHEFEADGAELRDPEAYANKGVLHVEVEFGPGRVDVYSTHLLAGGGLGEVFGVAGFGTTPPSEYRRRQVRELVAFVERTRSPENPAIVAGDFNVAADDEEYAVLERMADDLDLVDAWPDYGGRAGGTGGGQTTEQSAALREGCTLEPSAGPPYYCDDSVRADAGVGERIDYVFVSEPSPEHAVELDVSALRRVSFYRDRAPPGEFYVEDDEAVPNYLSDHVGLELRFSVEPASDDGEAGDGDTGEREPRTYTGRVDAGWFAEAPRVRRFEVPVEGDRPVELHLSADGEADLDLYVTLDGRAAGVDEYDRRSEGLDATETVRVDPAAVEGSLGVAVRAYDGVAEFRLRVQ
jgi:endonuclease/exonuclease/phosphatase family metal-dependent hydrolase